MAQPNTIPSGPYFGFNRGELQAELIRYKAEMKKTGSRLTGASQNGQSYTFGPRADWSLDDWQQNLQNALAYFGLADDLAPHQTAASFNTSGAR